MMDDGQTSIPSVIDAIIRAQQQLFSVFFFSILIIKLNQVNETKKDYYDNYQNFVNYFN
jgi:hypothetical protein